MFFVLNSGCAVTGSFSNTSTAAPAIQFSSSAFFSAISSTMPPRAVLITRADDLIARSSSSPIRLFVPSESVVCTVTKSESSISFASGTMSTPSTRARSSGTNGSCAMTRISSPFARRATSEPTCPRPITPSVLPRTSMPWNFPRSHFPDFSEALASGICRESDSMRAIACSAAEITLPVGAFTTTTPFSVAAWRSMLSTPMPARPTTWSVLDASKISRVTLVSLRTTSAS